MTATTRLLDCHEAAQRLHVCERTVRRYGKAGLLDERKVGPWLVRFTEASVEALKVQQGSSAA